MKLKSIAIQVKLDSLFELSISNMYFSEFFLLKCLGFMSFQWLSTHPTQQHSFLVSSKVKKNNMDKGLNLGLLFPRQRWSQVRMFTSFVYCKLLKIEISTGVKFSLSKIMLLSYQKELLWYQFPIPQHSVESIFLQQFHRAFT